MVRSRSYIATPPGATIKEQLNDREMSQKEFAARMDMSENHLTVSGDLSLPVSVLRLAWELYGCFPQGFRFMAVEHF